MDNKLRKVVNENIASLTLEEYFLDKNDNKEGKYIKKGLLSEQLIEKCFFKENKLHGISLKYNVDGEVIFKKSYLNGDPIDSDGDIGETDVFNIWKNTGNLITNTGYTITTTGTGTSNITFIGSDSSTIVN